jgi:hypothetical protein
MVSSVFMLHMKNEIIKALSSLISDIEEASPNTKSKLQEIYPISFSISLKGHKTIYISLDKNVKDISFTEKASIDFEIRSSVNEILQLLITRKIKKDILFGDIELAVVMMNAFINSDLDFIFLIDKYFGNTSAAIALLAKEKLSDIKRANSTQDNEIQSKLRDLSIRLDRLEAANIL